MTDMPELIWAKCDEVHGSIQIGGWADTIRQCPDGVEYVRADLPPKVKLPRTESSRFGDWIIPVDVLCEIRDEAGEWAEEAYLETVERIALAVEARILAALVQP
jgi:hypothetical protein